MLEEHKKKNRGRLGIVLDILSLIKRRRKARKTWIMYGTNLSFAQLNRYLGHLLALNLIKKVTIPHPKSTRKSLNPTYYVLTEKGKDIKKTLQELEEKIGWI